MQTPSRRTFAVTWIVPRLRSLLSSTSILVSNRCGLFSSTAMRLASLTNGMTNMSCSSSFLMFSSCCRWSSSSAAAFWAFFSSSWIRRCEASSCCFCLSSNSRCSLASSSAWDFACSAAAASCSVCSSRCLSQSCCKFSIFARYSSSRWRRRSAASFSAACRASSASRARFSSSSDLRLFSASSSGDIPLTSPWPPASSFRAFAYETSGLANNCFAEPSAGITKTK
mmetsp:Transcript_25863/g.48900  ORF Transcript_25863/g.48900 Transcript_25863/m.48900 type:complete len:226 (+) Transcript_25863:940-1617(+)